MDEQIKQLVLGFHIEAPGATSNDQSILLLVVAFQIAMSDWLEHMS